MTGLLGRRRAPERLRYAELQKLRTYAISAIPPGERLPSALMRGPVRAGIEEASAELGLFAAIELMGTRAFGEVRMSNPALSLGASPVELPRAPNSSEVMP